MDEDNSRTLCSQFDRQIRDSPEDSRSNELVWKEPQPSELMNVDKTERILITHIRATDVGIGLNSECFPKGIYVTVDADGASSKTMTKPVTLDTNEADWSDEIVLPSEVSTRLSIKVWSYVEPEPSLGNGEVLRIFEVTVAELLECCERHQPLASQTQESDVAGLSLIITVERRDCGPTEDAKGSDLGETQRLEDELVDIEKSISTFEEAVQLVPDGDPDKPSQLENLASSLLQRYNRLGALADIERSVSLREEVVHLTPDGHTRKPTLLNNLGISLCRRFERLGDIADINRAISLFENVLRVTPDDDTEKPSRLNNLGNSLLRQFERTGDIAILEKSISSLQASVKLTPSEDPDMPLLLNNLCNSLLTRFENNGDLADVENSISMLEEAVRLTPDDSPDKSSWLESLGNCLSTRFDHCGDLPDIDKSILVLREAVELTPSSHPIKASRLNALSVALLARFDRLGNLADLKNSISLLNDAVQLTPDDHPDKPFWLNSLGISLSLRFQHMGDLVDLQNAISRLEDSVKLIPDDLPDKPSWLTNLGISLCTRFNQLGHLSDIDKSIMVFEEAVRLTPDGHPNMPSRLNNLGSSLLDRFERFGELADLAKSISMKEAAVKLTADDHPDKPSWLNNLGNSLLTRFAHLGDTDDISKAISILEHGVQLTPDDHPHKLTLLNNLSNALLKCFDHSGDLADIERAISIREDVLRSCPDGHPERPLLLNNLGLSLLARFEKFGNVTDLDNSVLSFQDATRLTPEGHPSKPSRLSNLATSLLTRFEKSNEPSSSDLSSAISYSSLAARSPTGPTSDRFHASQIWIQCAHHLQDDSQPVLLDAYAVALALLPQLAWIGLPLRDRHRELLGAVGVVQDAAAAALEACQPHTAIEWLEQGRSIVWRQLLQLRTPLDDLRGLYSNLADEFYHVSVQLELASARESGKLTFDDSMDVDSDDTEGGSLEEQARRHHELAVRREELLAQIRSLPGFERFLLPQTTEQLSLCAHSGPVVILNASKLRCDALIITTGSDHVIHVPLPAMSYDEAQAMQKSLAALLSRSGRALERDGDRAAKLASRTNLDPTREFMIILSSLWHKVVKPILDALNISSETSGSRKLSRIFWCPTGPFTFLPLHAAGVYGAAKTGSVLSDFVISSYIPTLSALVLTTSDESGVATQHIRLTAVPQPPSDGQLQLANTHTEIDHIKKLSAQSQHVFFQESHGVVEDVLAKMAESDWVHFACHGIQDRSNPLDSGLLLADARRLKLSDIIRLSRPRGGLAFLSACQTATGDEQLSEEAVHLAAGMLLAGYSSVVATMWSIADSDAPEVAKDVYKMLFDLQDGKVPDSRLAALALHHAIKRLRSSGASFLSWVPFIHVGL